ncbi:transmembrane protease serine 11B-like protein [Acomys russatus]|uniref:transmembrane protease serine 11B-like protein n=1 Tax=Acomys russatus TaxID=60746 RepID=UPI0021E29903|nr:transmembrane protease serine 11B-like protein [Acomys russatus]
MTTTVSQASVGPHIFTYGDAQSKKIYVKQVDATQSGIDVVTMSFLLYRLILWVKRDGTPKGQALSPNNVITFSEEDTESSTLLTLEGLGNVVDCAGGFKEVNFGMHVVDCAGGFKEVNFGVHVVDCAGGFKEVNFGVHVVACAGGFKEVNFGVHVVDCAGGFKEVNFGVHLLAQLLSIAVVSQSPACCFVSFICRSVIEPRKSFPLWITILGVLGVLAALGLIIGLSVHFLAVENKIYYYQGSFKVLNIPYDRNYERETSPESNYLSKILETKMVDAFQSSNIYRQYINSQIITLVPESNSVTAHIWLVFKDARSKKENTRRRIESILRQMLESNPGSLTADPESLKLVEINKVDAEKIINSRCGRRPRMSATHDRIKGGSTAHKGEWPWQASLRVNGKHHCGASLVGERFLLTAAHCFQKTKNPKNLTISFGTRIAPPYLQHYVQEIIIHENYAKGDHHDDIAVIVLTEKVTFKNDVHRVCLPEATEIFSPGEGVVVTGWGALSHNGESPLLLQKAPVKIIDTNACNAEEAYGGRVEDTMLCAGYMEGNIDACQGDSGGPLVHPNSRDIWYLVGIVSWGDECGKINKPGVYTRVTAYRDWIAAKTGI